MVATFVAACTPRPPPVAVVGPEAPGLSAIPLERVCQEALPLPERSVGALFRLLRRINPALAVEVHPCRAGTSWPIGFATGRHDAHDAPIGFGVLKMEGDALLTFDRKDPDSPTINLCADLEMVLDAQHRLRAVALWDSTDENAFDPRVPERSTAVLAWLELLSRTPSACALGRKEGAAQPGEPWLAERTRCAEVPLVLIDRGGCDEVDARGPPPPPGSGPTAADVDRATAATHRFTGEGRTAAPEQRDLHLEGAETCLYEPPPAEHDVCLAVYTDARGDRWYGRGDVTRTGRDGEKNYVDSYLTFQLLRRIEAERKGVRARPMPAPAPSSKPSR